MTLTSSDARVTDFVERLGDSGSGRRHLLPHPQPTMAITNVEDVHRSTRLLAQTTLRNILGMKSLSEILSDREHISATMRVFLDRTHSYIFWQTAFM
jgi:hypothetical protein